VPGLLKVARLPARRYALGFVAATVAVLLLLTLAIMPAT